MQAPQEMLYLLLRGCRMRIFQNQRNIRNVEDAYDAAKTFGNSLLLLDRYFLSASALTRLAELNAYVSVRLEIVTKAK